MIHRLRLGLRDLLRRDRFERDMRAELDAYLDIAAAEYQRQGLSEADALRAARLELGGVEQARERVRAERTGALIETVGQDVRDAVRVMRRQPGLTVAAILTLALGIGAATAAIAVMRSVLFAPLPFADPERLVRLRFITIDDRGREDDVAARPADVEAIRSRSTLLEHVAAHRFYNAAVDGNDGTDRVVGVGVSDQWAETLGVAPALGRWFSAAERSAGEAAQVTVLSHALWETIFDGDPAIVGHSLRFNGGTSRVIGIMPPQFRFPHGADLWFPISMSPADAAGDLIVPARMRFGVSPEQLDAELVTIANDLHRTQPSGTLIRAVGIPVRNEFPRDPNRAITAFVAGVAGVLLIACVNLATLLTARGYGWANELALRSAIGATRSRQLRQLLTETLLIAAVGGIAGIAASIAASQWLGMLIPTALTDVVQWVAVDATTVSLAVLVIVGTGVVIGIAPALRLAGHAGVEDLRAGAPPSRGAPPFVLNILVSGEVALATILLTTGALMIGNYARLRSADIGYDADGLVRVNLTLSAVDAVRRSHVVPDVIERVVTLSGVTAAGVSNLHPIPRLRSNFGTSVESDAMAGTGTTRLVVNWRLVTPAYLPTLGVPLVAGRHFGNADRATNAPAVILNQAAADRLWPGQDPIGHRVRLDLDGPSPWHAVVGIVANIGEPAGAVVETLYQPYDQAATLASSSWVMRSASLLVRHSGESSRVVSDIRRAISGVDPSLPLFDIAEMKVALARPLSPQRFATTLIAMFGLFGVGMAILGTYGVANYSVSRRRREFGIRFALGATPQVLLRDVMSQGLRPVALGLLAGALASLLVSRMLRQVLTEVDPSDPLVLATAIVVILIAAAAAVIGPTLRVTRVSPTVTLRQG